MGLFDRFRRRKSQGGDEHTESDEQVRDNSREEEEKREMRERLQHLKYEMEIIERRHHWG